MEGTGAETVKEMMLSGLTVLRAENDTQQAMAVQRPRDKKRVMAQALEELDMAPQFAGEAWYSIPYTDRSGDGGEKKVMVEGPSIRAAMALCRLWGNCANAARVVDNVDDRVVVEGAFLDYETNLRTVRSVTVPKMRWDKYAKTMVPLREDRLNTAILAGMSKAVRNAVLASLPAYMVDGYVEHAKKVAAGEIKPKDPKKTYTTVEKIDWVKGDLVKMGVDGQRVESYINGLAIEDAEGVLAHLMGVRTAIKDGQAKIEDVFGRPTPSDAPVTAPGERHVPDASALTGGLEAPPKAEAPVFGKGKK